MTCGSLEWDIGFNRARLEPGTKWGPFAFARLPEDRQGSHGQIMTHTCIITAEPNRLRIPQPPALVPDPAEVDVSRAAAAGLTSQAILVRIATNDEDVDIRKLAVSKLENLTVAP
jgi:hypothetical protein